MTDPRTTVTLVRQRMKAADITDDAFLAAVRDTPSPRGERHDHSWRMRWEVKGALERAMGRQIPEKVFLAKAKRLMMRGLLGGCWCGCRGDYHFPQPRRYCCGACDKEFTKRELA